MASRPAVAVCVHPPPLLFRPSGCFVLAGMDAALDRRGGWGNRSISHSKRLILRKRYSLSDSTQVIFGIHSGNSDPNLESTAQGVARELILVD